MIKFSLPTNFEDRLLNEVNLLNKTCKNKGMVIEEVYGSLPKDIFGSGRPYFSLPQIDEEILERHINYAHNLGIKFNYILNTPCTGNLEYTKDGIKKIVTFLDYLERIKVDTITLSIPFLIELIANRYNFVISTSVICNVNSLSQVEYYQELGAKRITLDFSINREFKLLKLIRNNTDCELEVILNDTCLINCPLKNYHYAYVAHMNNINFDPIYERCVLHILEDKAQLIKSPWIRPEDIKIYEEFGINYFKVAGREATYQKIITTAKAYINQKLDGNLSSILSLSDVRCKHKKALKIFIDNKLLDNFINFFINKENSCYQGCINCNYCETVAQKVLRIDEKLRKEYINILNERQKELLYQDEYKAIQKDRLYPRSRFLEIIKRIGIWRAV